MHQNTRVKATQSGIHGHADVGKKLRSRAASRLKTTNQGRTGCRMREEENVGCIILVSFHEFLFGTGFGEWRFVGAGGFSVQLFGQRSGLARVEDHDFAKVFDAGNRRAVDACKRVRRVAFDMDDFGNRQAGEKYPVESGSYQYIAILHVGIGGHEA